MNIIIPVAGLGKRLRPHTWSRPKPLVSVAGKPMLGHVLDRLLTVPVEKVVFVTGYLGEQIEDHVRANYSFDVEFVEQSSPRGQSDAIIRARGRVSGETLVVFPDMLFEVDLNEALELEHDGALFVKEVEDPRKFGVVVKDGDRITRLVEKPQERVSNEAVIGIYYFKRIEDLFEGIDHQMRNDLQKDGEFFIADAIQYMIDNGKSITTLKASVWEDCGNPEALLKTNRYLLDTFGTQAEFSGNNVIIPPVVIDPSAKIEASVVGPYASIGANVEVRDSIVRNSIVDNGAAIQTAMLSASVIGQDALVSGDFIRINAGDSSDILLAAHARNGNIDNG